jgi:hypothetical protein
VIFFPSPRSYGERARVRGIYQRVRASRAPHPALRADLSP